MKRGGRDRRGGHDDDRTKKSRTRVDHHHDDKTDNEEQSFSYYGDNTDEQMNIDELYENAIRHITRGSSTRTYDWKRFEERGLLENSLWPKFISLLQDKKKKESNDESSSAEELQKYAFVMAHLMNIKLHSVGTTSSTSPLLVLLNHTHPNKNDEGMSSDELFINQAFQTWLSLLVHCCSNSTEHEQQQYMTIVVVEFLSNCFNHSLDISIVKDSLVELVNSPLLFQSNVHKRRQQLEFAKSPTFQTRFENDLNKTNTRNSPLLSTSTTFIPHLITHLKTLMESLFTTDMNKEENEMTQPATNNKSENARHEDDDDDDNNSIKSEKEEDDNKDEQAYDTTKRSIKKNTPFVFVSTVLNFIKDLLMNPFLRGPYLKLYLEDQHLMVHCAMMMTSPLGRSNEYSKLFDELLKAMNFAVQDIPTAVNTTEETSGETTNNMTILQPSLSEHTYIKQYHNKCSILQRLCHKYYPNQMKEFALGGVHMACQYHFLYKHLTKLSTKDLSNVCYKLRLIHTRESDEEMENKQHRRNFLLALLMYEHSLQPSLVDVMTNNMPVYPNELLLWNQSSSSKNVENDDEQQQGVFHAAYDNVPKLNLHFLSMEDYLIRNFSLVQKESSYEIRSDIVDAIKRLHPTLRNQYEEDEILLNSGDAKDDNEALLKQALVEKENTLFKGWARMAVMLKSFRFLKVSVPHLGEVIPSSVTAELIIDLDKLPPKVQQEWDDLREHDVLFLISVNASRISEKVVDSTTAAAAHDEGRGKAMDDEHDMTFPQRYGIQYVRGCMVLEVRDEAGTTISINDYGSTTQTTADTTTTTVRPQGTKRYLRVSLDSSQFASDATKSNNNELGTNLYQTFNVVVRRKGKENNFKAVLETLRELMISSSKNEGETSWFHRVLLGQGDPTEVCYSSEQMRSYSLNTVGVTKPTEPLDYFDTFVDEDHLKNCYCLPGSEHGIVIRGRDNKAEKVTPQRQNYRIIEKHITTTDSKAKKIVEAIPYEFTTSASGGAAGNQVRFTPVQIEAIRSGLHPGLTLVVGPPGSGKTDVAVQMISNLFHSFPTQRTLLVTHSNAALNDLFEKVSLRKDIPERYMLRLGSGEQELSLDEDYTKMGRVSHILQRRQTLLNQVQDLAESLGVSHTQDRGPNGESAYTCETAHYFYLHHVLKHIQEFNETLEVTKKDGGSGDNKKEEGADDVTLFFPFKQFFDIGGEQATIITRKEANQMFQQLHQLFEELKEYRPLEMLRTQRQRIDYLLMKQARVIAMTCTHASIARSHLLQCEFQYDNVIVEEAAQMLDIETFVPLALQKHSDNNRLKRVCLIGDHFQLPPILKDRHLVRHSHMDQSLFTRLIKLGVPHIQLNRQGRSRPEIAKLFSWRYDHLGNLEHVLKQPDYLMANAGFRYTYQFINVENYQGRGETTPTPYFYQNVGEAEYAVALFQYMVLIGYPPEKITLLTMYNGQKELLQDILAQRCSNSTPLRGIRPGAISTVDQYQGQQNSYIILSMVRTKSIGHIRDIRRMIVAVSRARLGLYIVGRQELFDHCHELHPFTSLFQQHPNQLHLIKEETYRTKRPSNSHEEDIPNDKIYIVEDATDLGGIVHSMQQSLCS